jgi:hypothetical protein
MAACAAFIKESRMRFVDPSKPYRKSGGMGHPPFVMLSAVPNTNRGLIENLFLLSRYRGKGPPETDWGADKSS